jgi:hypothetical protein
MGKARGSSRAAKKAKGAKRAGGATAAKSAKAARPVRAKAPPPKKETGPSAAKGASVVPSGRAPRPKGAARTKPAGAGARKPAKPTKPTSKTSKTSKASKANKTKKSAAAAAEAERRDVYDLVTIGITPPELAPDTEAYDLNATLANRATRPAPEEIAVVPWLAQDRAYRAGYYLLTHGLRMHAEHPELEICNVPGALLNAAQSLLNHLADYVLNHRSFAHGEVMMLSESPLAAVGFMTVGPHERGTVHDVDVLRVVFLR